MYFGLVPQRPCFGISSPGALKEVFMDSTKIPARERPGQEAEVCFLITLLQRASCLSLALLVAARF